MLPLLYATASHAGVVHRDRNEDCHVAVVDAFPGPAFAVFDGHGGAAASSYLSDPNNLIAVVASELQRTIGDDLVDAMTRGRRDSESDRLKQTYYAQIDESFASVVARAFHEVDDTMLQAIAPKLDGSTAIVVWLVGSRDTAGDDAGITLYCANVGDSRAVLCRGGEAVALSTDHRPSDPTERARIERHGGVVHTLRGSTVQRVYSPAAAQLQPAGTPIKCLAMARSFGDRPLKQPVQCVTCEPDVRTERLGRDDVLVVLASDGVWDALTNQQAVDLALQHFGDPEAAARAIVWRAQQRGSKDDVTATVVQFGWQRDRVHEIQQTIHAMDQQRQTEEVQAFASAGRTTSV